MIPPIVIKILGKDAFSKKLTESQRRLRAFGRSAQRVGRSMTRSLTMPIGLAGFAIARVATSFESSMNKVAALTQATGKPLKQLREQAKQLGIETKFSAREVAEGMAFLGMAGFDTNKILAATPGLLDLAAASGIDLARAADIVSNMLGRFGLEAKESGRVADILATITASANVDMEMLEETMKMAGPIAKDFGASLEDTAVLAGFLGNMGIQGSLGGTAMKNMFVRLAAPASAANKILNKLGVTTMDAKRNLLPYADILKNLAKKMSSLGSADRMKVLDTLFGKRAMAGASGLLRDINKTNSGFARLGKAMDSYEGRAKTMADIMMRGAPGAFKKFTSALEGVAIAIAESGFLDFLGTAAEKLSYLFRAIARTSPGLLKLATIIAGIIFVLGPLITAVAALGITLQTVGWPITLTIAIIGVLIATLVLGALIIRRHWDPIKELFKNVYEWIKKVVDAFDRLQFKKLASLFKIGGGTEADKQVTQKAQADMSNFYNMGMPQFFNGNIDVNVKSPPGTIVSASSEGGEINVMDQGPSFALENL